HSPVGSESWWRLTWRGRQKRPCPNSQEKTMPLEEEGLNGQALFIFARGFHRDDSAGAFSSFSERIQQDSTGLMSKS
ncbi:MAG: hypothetical protein M1553_06140, partial [Firmicutes bacterium]|nr:hypothetical protein [Bacillota bacterium]